MGPVSAVFDGSLPVHNFTPWSRSLTCRRYLVENEQGCDRPDGAFCGCTVRYDLCSSLFCDRVGHLSVSSSVVRGCAPQHRIKMRVVFISLRFAGNRTWGVLERCTDLFAVHYSSQRRFVVDRTVASARAANVQQNSFCRQAVARGSRNVGSHGWQPGAELLRPGRSTPGWGAGRLGSTEPAAS